MAASPYQIRIRGQLSETTLLAFEGLTAQVNPVDTVLTGALLDQAALHGVLEQIQSLGLELLEVRRLSVDSHVPCDERSS